MFYLLISKAKMFVCFICLDQLQILYITKAFLNRLKTKQKKTKTKTKKKQQPTNHISIFVFCCKSRGLYFYFRLRWPRRTCKKIAARSLYSQICNTKWQIADINFMSVNRILHLYTNRKFVCVGAYIAKKK